MQSIPVSFARYRRLSNEIKRVSITRALQYEIIRSHSFKGRLLDVGGGKNADYISMIDCDHYEAVNIDQDIQPTWKIEVGEQFPCPAECYDTVISFNTLEHVFNPTFTISEIARVMKTGAELVITTPFLYPIHGHPDDYFRPTPSWYLKTLTDIGFRDVKILPLFWGPFSTGQTCSGIPGPAKALRKQIALLLDYTHSISRKVARSRDHNETVEDYRFSTGFFIFAIK